MLEKIKLSNEKSLAEMENLTIKLKEVIKAENVFSYLKLAKSYLDVLL